MLMNIIKGKVQSIPEAHMQMIYPSLGNDI